ncbi:hypothetical protein PTTG_27983 [Puccinia triticina 1-1 BBBD Race 1]|uniref:Uncharacterized protein n=1 Tax=Puccinia triticina (isolate 1-1 / race 1 (BBBD)) TaxID=630390 RepID=A0A180GFF9_PUCT1|nr:hypothetical protein PTTG_27983 [Puccinia triticina 1-1 BBBD Race 1]
MQVPENATVDTPLAFGEDSHSGARLFNRPILENIDALPILGLTPSQLWLHPAKDSSKLVTIAAGQKAVGIRKGTALDADEWSLHGPPPSRCRTAGIQMRLGNCVVPARAFSLDIISPGKSQSPVATHVNRNSKQKEKQPTISWKSNWKRETESRED